MAALIKFIHVTRLGCTRTVVKKSVRNIIYKSMDNLTEIKFEPLKDSIYLKPFRMTYKQNAKQKYWDLMELHDSVAIIIYNTSRKVLIFVKQFRPGVYYGKIPPEVKNTEINTEKYKAELGMTIELCAGIVDKDKSLVEIAKEEVLEECGYDVPISSFEKLHTYCGNIGVAGNVLNMFYCEVTDEMKLTTGGGVDDEMIEVVEMTLEEYRQYVLKPVIPSPGSVCIGYYWFLTNKPQHCKINN